MLATSNKIDCILTVNVGSATLKFAIFQANKGLRKIYSGLLERASNGEDLWQPLLLIKWIKRNYPDLNIKIMGHRVVHGGKAFLQPTLITRPVLAQLKKLIKLAPLHMPGEIDFIDKARRDLPDIPQVACFDTSFHRTQKRLASIFAIPRKYTERDGIVRYGFHGLSYEYIANKLNKKSSKVIAAHLGQGASLCAIHKNKSVATSMGFSTLDGLVMGTRCGNIDPGVLLYLLSEKKLSVKALEIMLYNESGLLGVSGRTGDMRELLKNKDPKSKDAIDLFCYSAMREIGSLIAALEGLDALVFTGGIGENSWLIRDKICSYLNWLGLKIDNSNNRRNALKISKAKSKIDVYIIPTNEELLIAKYSLGFIK